MTQVTEADSGFTAQNIADAEALWSNLPVFPQKWHTMQTYQRAAVCHAVQRFREQAVAEAVAGIVAWLRSDAQTCDCFAKSASECGCGAWDTEPGERSYKRVTEEDIADAIERGDWK